MVSIPAKLEKVGFVHEVSGFNSSALRTRKKAKKRENIFSQKKKEFVGGEEKHFFFSPVLHSA